MSSRRANGRIAAAMIWAVFAGAVSLAGGAMPLAAQTGTTDPLATGQAGTPVEIEAD